MDPTLFPRVKICCIASVEEARVAHRQGAAALGLVSAMPSGPGVIDEELIAQIAATVPPGVDSFLLTCSQDPAEIIRQQQRTRVSTLQLCDRLPTSAFAELRHHLPGIRLVQVVHVVSESSIDEARKAAPFVDALLLDSGRPDLPVKELGGTGRRHDWTISRQIREQVEKPIFLAGGLRPDNVAEAIREVGPYGLDLCTGVRTEGRLDPVKLSRFFQAVAGSGSEVIARVT